MKLEKLEKLFLESVQLQGQFISNYDESLPPKSGHYYQLAMDSMSQASSYIKLAILSGD